MTDVPPSPEIHHHEDHLDHCTCDIELGPDEITHDAALPPASGGVQMAAATALDEDRIDACDADFTGGATTDDELPAATGGVA